MILPYRIAALFYCFNEQDEVLLIERTQEPNRGLWSPCSGHLQMDLGEAPYACACREAGEELGLTLQPCDMHLTGLLSVYGYQEQMHLLIFIFEVLKKLTDLPPEHKEGRFQFFSLSALTSLKLPQTELEIIWPWFWQYRNGFFAAHCHCHPDGRKEWTLEEARMENQLAAENLRIP